jgi:hypothetical protein
VDEISKVTEKKTIPIKIKSLKIQLKIYKLVSFTGIIKILSFIINCLFLNIAQDNVALNLYPLQMGTNERIMDEKGERKYRRKYYKRG